MTEKKKTRSEQKRDAILEAAKQAFHQFGVQNTSMDKLAALAGVSKRTVYNHFESKEVLVMRLLADLWQQSMSDIDTSPLQNLDIKQQLVYLLQNEIAILNSQAYIELAKVAFGYYFYRPEEVKQQVEKLSKQETALYKWLQSQSEQNLLKIADVSLASTQLHNLIKGSCFWPQLMGMDDLLSEEQVQRLAESTAELFLSAYQ